MQHLNEACHTIFLTLKRLGGSKSAFSRERERERDRERQRKRKRKRERERERVRERERKRERERGGVKPWFFMTGFLS